MVFLHHQLIHTVVARSFDIISLDYFEYCDIAKDNITIDYNINFLVALIKYFQAKEEPIDDGSPMESVYACYSYQY
jgi:hypothetical protein